MEKCESECGTNTFKMPGFGAATPTFTSQMQSVLAAASPSPVDFTPASIGADASRPSPPGGVRLGGGGGGGGGLSVEAQLVDYRGEKVAGFEDEQHQQGTLICLPQAYELFLKNLVGGLHTVYTKLKRLDITPRVCNVEQVRALRSLGAIQPGVNRCKLISRADFDALYRDCTNTSSRPGRPPKRTAFPPNTVPPASSWNHHHHQQQQAHLVRPSPPLPRPPKRLKPDPSPTDVKTLASSALGGPLLSAVQQPQPLVQEQQLCSNMAAASLLPFAQQLVLSQMLGQMFNNAAVAAAVAQQQANGEQRSPTGQLVQRQSEDAHEESAHDEAKPLNLSVAGGKQESAEVVDLRDESAPPAEQTAEKEVAEEVLLNERAENKDAEGETHLLNVNGTAADEEGEPVGVADAMTAAAASLSSMERRTSSASSEQQSSVAQPTAALLSLLAAASGGASRSTVLPPMPSGFGSLHNLFMICTNLIEITAAASKAHEEQLQKENADLVSKLERERLEKLRIEALLKRERRSKNAYLKQLQRFRGKFKTSSRYEVVDSNSNQNETMKSPPPPPTSEQVQAFSSNVPLVN